MDEPEEERNPDDEPAEQPHPARETKGVGEQPASNPEVEEKAKEEEP